MLGKIYLSCPTLIHRCHGVPMPPTPTPPPLPTMHPPCRQVTMGFNNARILEAAGDLKAAEAEFRAILDQFPQYGDCYLRLSCIARAKGDMEASGKGVAWWENEGCVRAGVCVAACFLCDWSVQTF
jgi:hypothetical protein